MNFVHNPEDRTKKRNQEYMKIQFGVFLLWCDEKPFRRRQFLEIACKYDQEVNSVLCKLITKHILILGIWEVLAVLLIPTYGIARR